MSLETATYINQLDAANPLGSDPIASGDDHIRLIKATVKATFPNITGVMNVTHTDLNTKVPNAVQKTGDTMTGALVLSGAPTADLQAATKAYVDSGDAAAVSTAASSAASLYPTKTGTGASGTWGINISGNAATATTASNGGVTSVNGSTGAVTVPSLGVGQTWQNPARSLGTTYTNSTGAPIAVSVMISLGNNATATLTVGGVIVARNRGREGAYIQGTYSDETLYAVVPNGATYVASGGSLISWAELR
jgi:hypothetical protein